MKVLAPRAGLEPATLRLTAGLERLLRRATECHGVNGISDLAHFPRIASNTEKHRVSSRGTTDLATARSVRRHQPPQFLEPVLDDDHLRRLIRGNVFTSPPPVAPGAVRANKANKPPGTMQFASFAGVTAPVRSRRRSLGFPLGSSQRRFEACVRTVARPCR